MPRRPRRDPSVVVAELAVALAAWRATGCAAGPELDAVIEILWSEFGAALIAYFGNALPKGHQDQDQDLAQTLFTDLLLDLERFELRGYEELRGWIWRRARHVVTNWVRRENRDRRSPKRIDASIDPADLGTKTADPLDSLLLDELWRRLLPRLTTRQLEVLSLLRDGLSREEIAQRLGCTTNAIYILISRIRAILDELFGDGAEGTES